MYLCVRERGRPQQEHGGYVVRCQAASAMEDKWKGGLSMIWKQLPQVLQAACQLAVGGKRSFHLTPTSLKTYFYSELPSPLGRKTFPVWLHATICIYWGLRNQIPEHNGIWAVLYTGELNCMPTRCHSKSHRIVAGIASQTQFLYTALRTQRVMSAQHLPKQAGREITDISAVKITLTADQPLRGVR